MAYNCWASECAVPPHPNLLARRRDELLQGLTQEIPVTLSASLPAKLNKPPVRGLLK